MSHTYGFSTWIGWAILIVSVIVGLVLFSKRRKVFPLLYLSAAALYTYGITFVMDRFHLNDIWTFVLLIISGIIMILLGVYLKSSSR